MDFGIPITGNESCVDTVRALHQTIVALRTALDKSRSEILELKSRNWSEHNVQDTIKNLSLENHILREKVINKQSFKREPVKKDNKQKRVKNKESKDKVEIEKGQQAQDSQLPEDKYINIQVTSEIIDASQRISKSLENISFLRNKPSTFNNQLSKSKTVCFSNTFDGESQISTTNSLYITNLKSKSSTVTGKTDFHESCLVKQKVDENKIKEKKPTKSKKNLQFKEKVIDNNLTASRRGSISNFSEEHSKDFKELKQYVECISESKKLLERCYEKKNKISGKLKETGKNKSTDKSTVKQFHKREATFLIDKTKVSDEDNIEVASTSKEARRPSSLLGELVELALTRNYPEQNQQVHDIIKNYDYKNNVSVVQKEDLILKEKVNNVSKEISNEQLLKLKEESSLNEAKIDNTIKCEILKITNLESAEIESIDENNAKTSAEEIKKYSTIQKEDEENVDTIQKIKKEKDSENRKEAKETEREESEKNISEDVNTSTIDKNSVDAHQIKPKIPQSTVKSSDLSTKDNNVDISISNNSERDSDNTLKTSETSSNSSAQKNVEISVKIYKGSKKPVEIDIQTKKKHHSKKKGNKKPKMNNKTQSTSIDKEYVEAISTVNVNQLSTNEVRRNVDHSTADNIVGNLLQNDIEQEVDDIELIFTTDDTKETDFKEELVPIDTYAETQLLQCPFSDYDEKLSADASDRELEDDVFNDNFENENQENCNFQSQTYDFRRENSQIYNSKSDNSINHEDKSLKSYYSYQDSSFENKSMEKDESFDRFEEKTRIIETDISKIGIQDVEYNLGRRNTCPNPIQYRPIMHREALGRGLNSRKCRPILAHSNVIRKESGAQTDISALPGSSWRSESSLGHKVKVGENFTTLPSKFPHPGSRLRLSEKTVEARRVLLSDIGFTSMVPELSRSADHLCPPVVRGPTVTSYGQFLRTTDLYSPAYTSQKFVWTTTTPSEGSHSQSRYSSQYPLSSPPAPTRRCSAPVSPSKRTVMKSTPSRVRFANGSLPELRGDWTATVDSGESTDSLVEEAEHFLRRSIDCLAPCRDVCFRNDNSKMAGVRRASAPEPTRDNVPPQGWQPFLPRIPRDLHLDYWVKVISPEGRVRGGRVRYVGPLMNQPEAFVGVQLSTPDGHSDGTYNNRRYFNCEPYHGLFVPFKKIIMGWRP